MSTPSHKEDNPMVHSALGNAASFLSNGKDHVLRELGQRLPEVKVVDVPHRPLWWMAALTATVAGVLLAVFQTLISTEALSVWLGFSLKLISSVVAAYLSIRVNNILVERSQSSMEITEDLLIHRKRRFVLRRNHERKTPSRGA